MTTNTMMIMETTSSTAEMTLSKPDMIGFPLASTLLLFVAKSMATGIVRDSAVHATPPTRPTSFPKDGMLAGPKVLEHLVDAVLTFEGDRYASHRIIRTVKNRFGATNELGVFEMQRKGLLAHSKTALDKQVDEIMTFDGNAFEAFKRSIGNARAVGSVKIASDLGGVNIGVESEQASAKSSGGLMTADTLTSMWD